MQVLTKKEKRGLIGLTLGTVLLSLSEVFSFGIIVPIMVLFINPQKMHTIKAISMVQQWTGIAGDRQFLCFLIAAAVILYCLKCVYSFFIYRQQQGFVGSAYNRLTNKALLAYLDKPYTFYLMNNSSVLFKNLISELNLFVFGFLSACISLASELLLFLGILVLLFATYPQATISLGIIFGVLAAFINLFLKKRIKDHSDNREKYAEEVYKSAFESLNAVKEVKVYNAQDFFARRFFESTSKHTKVHIGFTVLSTLPRFILEATLFSAMLLYLLYCVLSGKNASDIIPMMTLITAVSLRLLPSFNKIYLNISTIHYNARSLDILLGILKDEKNEIPSRPSSRDIAAQPEDANTIKLEGVTFCYDTAPAPILDKLTITIPLQKTVALLGASGAGKSTLIDIIMGLLTPSQGRLLYKNEMIGENNMEGYRRKIGYVPQQIFLVDDTLEANIAFGVTKDRIDKQQLERVVELTQLTGFVEKLPLGIQTVVGERGIRLSGGQRQRIGIARALYRNPEILILDEGTSALDENTESQLHQAVRNISDSLTIIVITHRLSTIEHADIVYLMEDGKIIATGKFEELAKDPALLEKISKRRLIDEKN